MTISTPRALALTAVCALTLAACSDSSGGNSAAPSSSASVDVGNASQVTPVDAATLARAKKQGSVLLYTHRG
jgi:iron(III) transport system substrate-binding protein